METTIKATCPVDLNCEIRTDNLTRQLYSTDASIYQIEPQAVALPRSAEQAANAIQFALENNLPITPRGAGTGLVGGALGNGLIIDFSRHNRQITELDLDRHSVRVGAGVVLDQLNAFLKPHGYCFGPDVATSSRATLGGMIANNSSGSHTPVYGTTADHVRSLQLVMADSSIQTVGREFDALPRQKQAIEVLCQQFGTEISARFPAGLLKRWPGYGIDRWCRAPGNLSDLLAGSEGTLAAIFSAELNIVPLPKRKDVGLVFFASVADAMQATVELLELQPAAIEHIDRVLFDQTRSQLTFRTARDLLQLDDKPCESILVVEFYDDDSGKLEMLRNKRLGSRTLILRSSDEINHVWALRKAGLSLLTGRPGPAKPVTCVEDTVVQPSQLPEYVSGLQNIFAKLNLEASFYGHAASGLLHVRPVLDLHSAADLQKFRQLSNEVSALVRQFKGSLAGEHGVGIARTEFLKEHLGSDLMKVFREIKNTFDPKDSFNPGKIIDNGRFKIDSDLRMGANYALNLPFTPTLAFASKDHSFIGNLEQCNGCGGCRKDAPTMCPTFLATGEEVMSTRGRANAIRAALELRGTRDALLSAEMETALSNCLSCKACTTECPSNVNMALLKAELLHVRWQREGLPLSVRMFSNVDLLGKLGSIFPAIANASLRTGWLRWGMEKFLGISARRPLPAYSSQRFDHWFRRQSVSTKLRRVILWDDTFTRYHEPEIGMAAVKVLEAAGFQVALVRQRKCCGRPAFSQGHLNKATELARHNLSLLSPDDSTPILFLEPSCYSMFVEDYRELNFPEASQVAKRCFLFEEFMDQVLAKEPNALRFKNQPTKMAIHAHCHAKSLLNPKCMIRLAQRLPDCDVTLLDTGCCGMAGAFGAMESKHELSLKVAAPLIQQIKDQPSGTQIVASGTSCRHQIGYLSTIHPKHMAELLADALENNVTER